MVRLLIARHGNTFDAGDVIRRVGRGTDLPLSKSGQKQACDLGVYLSKYHPDIAAVYTSTLMRTFQTATIALDEMGKDLHITQSEIFDEIDYGPDEGQPEIEVLSRLGEDALKLWDQQNVVPQDWDVDPDTIKNNWLAFSQAIQEQFDHQTVLVVTSNGNARFAPEHPVKLSTGALSSIVVDNDQWVVEYTNKRPHKEMQYAQI